MNIDYYKQMRAKWLFRLSLIIFIALLLLHFAAIENCSGWNEASVEVESCAFDSGLARAVANQLYAMVLLSSYALGIPILLYCAILWAISRIVASVLLRFLSK